MIVVEGLLAGLWAGLLMGLASELLYRLGLFKISQFLIDGSFITARLEKPRSQGFEYAIGIPIHILTGVVFGIVYYVGTDLLDWEASSFPLIVGYSVLLWLAMLFNALPLAGQGIAGQKAGAYHWVEQLVTHAVFALGLWWAVSII